MAEPRVLPLTDNLRFSLIFVPRSLCWVHLAPTLDCFISPAIVCLLSASRRCRIENGIFVPLRRPAQQSGPSQTGSWCRVSQLDSRVTSAKMYGLEIEESTDHILGMHTLYGRWMKKTAKERRKHRVNYIHRYSNCPLSRTNYKHHFGALSHIVVRRGNTVFVVCNCAAYYDTLARVNITHIR